MEVWLNQRGNQPSRVEPIGRLNRNRVDSHSHSQPFNQLIATNSAKQPSSIIHSRLDNCIRTGVTAYNGMMAVANASVRLYSNRLGREEKREEENKWDD